MFSVALEGLARVGGGNTSESVEASMDDEQDRDVLHGALGDVFDHGDAARDAVNAPSSVSVASPAVDEQERKPRQDLVPLTSLFLRTPDRSHEPRPKRHGRMSHGIRTKVSINNRYLYFYLYRYIFLHLHIYLKIFKQKVRCIASEKSVTEHFAKVARMHLQGRICWRVSV